MRAAKVPSPAGATAVSSSNRVVMRGGQLLRGLTRRCNRALSLCPGQRSRPRGANGAQVHGTERCRSKCGGDGGDDRPRGGGSHRRGTGVRRNGLVLVVAGCGVRTSAPDPCQFGPSTGTNCETTIVLTGTGLPVADPANVGTETSGDSAIAAVVDND